MQPREEITVLTKEHFFRPNENMHIQRSDEFPDYIGIWHKHEYIEIVYVISGHAVHKIGDKVYQVKRGDLFIVNKNTPHSFCVEKTSGEPFVAYDLMFTSEFFDSSMSGYQPLETLKNSFMFHSLFAGRTQIPPFFSVTGKEYTQFGEIFNKIYLEHRGREKGYSEIIRAYLLQLIITIFRLDEKKTNIPQNTRSQRIVYFIIDYINENYQSPISVSELSKKVYLHADYLGRLFRRFTGTTITAMIQKVRIENACNLLTTTDQSISEIAFSCGFEDSKFFYTVFKKFMGVSPGVYRKLTQKKEP